MPFFVHHTILERKFFRIFALLNFESVTGIGLYTSFEEITVSYSLLQVSSLKYIFRLNELCKICSEYVEIKYIIYTTVL